MDHLQGARRRHHAGMVLAAGLLAFLFEEGDAPDDLVGLGELVEQQVIALACRAADAVGAAGREPQRRVRALQGRGLDHDVVVVPALAVMAEARLARPALLITSIASSKRSVASSIGMQKPSNSAWR